MEIDHKDILVFNKIINSPKIGLIGCGGIGSHLAINLGRYIASLNRKGSYIKLVDGDTIEPKNLNRQNFSPKYDYAFKVEELLVKLDRIKVKAAALPRYVGIHNVRQLIRDNQIIILAVDNHYTRKLVNRRALELENIIVISAGNNIIDGSVRTFMRLNGKNFTSDLEYLDSAITNAPEIAEDRKIGCEELLETDPQVIWSNVQAASIVGQLLFKILEWYRIKGKEEAEIPLLPAIVHFNILRNTQSTEDRPYSLTSESEHLKRLSESPIKLIRNKKKSLQKVKD